MDLLLDTSALLWWVTGDQKLGGQARAAIGDPVNRVYVSAASAWEVAIKYRIGKLPMPRSPSLWLPAELASNAFTPLPISLRHALAVESLPLHHRDPFDRLLIAQAASESLTIVTGDHQLERYGVQILRC